MEKKNEIVTKLQKKFAVFYINSHNKDASMDQLELLALEYATSFWAGKWKELLKAGNRQYGTFDENGGIYPETLALAERYGVSTDNVDWPLTLWRMAGQDNLRDEIGNEIQQFWTMESAKAELSAFITGIQDGGFGGEIAIAVDDNQEIVAFTAYTVLENYDEACNRRYHHDNRVNLIFESGDVSEQSLSDILHIHFSHVARLGIFLDHAVSEKFRGSHVGSALFDLRLENMFVIGAELIVGRTLKTEPAQFYGNYLKRGFSVFLTASNDQNKKILTLKKSGLRSR